MWPVARTILFVFGFATDTLPVYDSLFHRLEQTYQAEITPFAYRPTEQPAAIHARLYQVYYQYHCATNKTFDVIMAHSMGAFFVTELMLHAAASSSNKCFPEPRIILLMPFVVVSGGARTIAAVPSWLERFMYLPSSIAAPRDKITACTDPTRPASADRTLLPLQLQIKVTKQVSSSDFLANVQRMLAMHPSAVIYGENDGLVQFTRDQVAQLARVTSVFGIRGGKHAPFNDCTFIQERFYQALQQSGLLE